MGIEGVIGKLKANLIVSLACCAMTDCLGLFLFCNLHLGLCNQGSSYRCPEKIFPFIHCPSPKHGKDKVPDKLLFQVLYINLACTGLYGLFLERSKLLSLTQISRKCNNLAMVIFHKPLDNNGSIKTAGVGYNDFFNLRHLILQTIYACLTR